MFEFSPAYSILAIDGGGIRGIIPCKVLMYIEKRLGLPVGDLFDLMAGTSTGGILACGLSIKDAEGNSRFPADKLIDLYCGKEGKKIFSPPWPVLNGLRNLFRSKFTGDNVEGVLREFFGDARLSDACTDLLVTSYDIQQKKPFYFRSSEARSKPDVEDFFIWQIARATSAAPTYFPPTSIPYKGSVGNRPLGQIALIDGGVFANNPSLLAYIEAREKWKNSEEYREMVRQLHEAQVEEGARGMFAEVRSDNYEAPFLLLSIGTGQSRVPYNYDKSRSWGVINWALPTIDILMQGVSESVDFQMHYLLPPFDDPARTPRYVRINIELDPAHSAMDDAGEENICRLRDEYGERVVEENRRELDRACDMLQQIYQRRQERRPAEV